MNFYDQLWPDHPIREMMDEHQIILCNLDRLEALVGRLDQGFSPEDRTLLNQIAENLLAAEPHHQREEEVIFPRLEELGIEGPPELMRQEHVALRKLKHEIKDLAVQGEPLPFGAFKEQLTHAALSLIGQLRDHIEREDTILYEEAVRQIEDESEWEEMKAECQEIGPCHFR